MYPIKLNRIIKPRTKTVADLEKGDILFIPFDDMLYMIQDVVVGDYAEKNYTVTVIHRKGSFETLGSEKIYYHNGYWSIKDYSTKNDTKSVEEKNLIFLTMLDGI